MKMGTLFVLTFAVGSIACLTNPAMAAKPHTQKISQESAEAFCKKHGGGTDCGYKEGDHLHLIHCDKGGKCYNTVNPARKVPSGKTRTNVSGTKTSNGSSKVSNKNVGRASVAGKTGPQTKALTKEHRNNGGGNKH